MKLYHTNYCTHVVMLYFGSGYVVLQKMVLPPFHKTCRKYGCIYLCLDASIIATSFLKRREYEL
jgi:hypothetical protein